MSKPVQRRPDRELAAALLLFAILALAAFLRLHALGEIDFRGDEVTYYLDLQDKREPMPWLVDHLHNFGHDRQMPLPRVSGAALVHLLGLEVDANAVRLPFAAAGALSILAFWCLGWQLGRLAGQQAFLLAAWLALAVTVNPFHLYWSRTAHIYVFPMLFLGLALACACAWLVCLREAREGSSAGRAWLAATLVASLLAGYSHMSAWIGGGLLWILLIGAWLRRHRPELIPTSIRHRVPGVAPQPRAGFSNPFGVEEKGNGKRRIAEPPWPRALLIATGVWTLALAPWAWQFVTALFGASYDPVWDEQSNPLTRFSAMWRVPFILTWGGGWRSALTLGLPVAAFVLGWRHRRWSGVVRLLAAGLVALFALLSLAQSTGFFAVRYYVPLWPLLIVSSGLGMLLLGEALARRFAAGHESAEHRRMRRLVYGLLATLPLAACIVPVRALLDLRGNPVEFTRLAEHLDSFFPEGTPALVNGMNVVLFEMRPHSPEKVLPAFTVPDIGLGQWRNRDWRASAEDFLRRFPRAPLVQQGRNYYRHPEIGPWAFPDEYFARRLVLRNEPALKLRRLLLGGSLDFYSGQEADSRAVVTISYNLPEDVIERARTEGRQALALFGDGWGYFKREDYSDWRALEGRAEVVLHNLGERAAIEVAVHAFSATGVKELRVHVKGEDRAGDAILTPIAGPFVWRFSLTVEPGVTELELIDELYDAGRAPLLVSRLEATPASGDDTKSDAVH